MYNKDKLVETVRILKNTALQKTQDKGSKAENSSSSFTVSLVNKQQIYSSKSMPHK